MTPQQAADSSPAPGQSASVDQLLKLLEVQNSWVRHAEAKALAVLGATAGVVTGASAILRAFGRPSTVGTCIGLLALAAAVGTILTAVGSLQPRMTPQHGSRTEADTVFFADLDAVAKGIGLDATCARLAANAADPDVFAHGLTRQLVSVSQVAVVKFDCARRAIWGFAVTLPLVVATILGWQAF